MERTIANPIPRLIPRTTKPGSWSGRLCWSGWVPPAGFEPALPPPEGGALSPELRGPCVGELSLRQGLGAEGDWEEQPCGVGRLWRWWGREVMDRVLWRWLAR